MLRLESRGESCQAHLAELVAIAREVEQLRARFEVPKMKQTLERLRWRLLWDLLHEPPKENSGDTFTERVETIETSIDVGEKLNLNLNLERPQELCFSYLTARDNFPIERAAREPQRFHKLLRLGQKLAIDNHPWLEPSSVPDSEERP